MIKLCAFADEASSCFKEQIEALKRNGISYIELRGLDGKNVSALTLKEAKSYAEQLKEAGITVWSVGSPLGKVNLADDFEAYKEKVRHVCALANVFETKRIRMFSFFEAYENGDLVISHLKEMVEIGREYGVYMCHENEKAIYGDKVERIEQLLDAVADMRYVYDPANFLEVGEDPDKTLTRLHGRADYYHVKDVIRETGELVPAGYGDGQIGRMIAMLDPSGEFTMTVEPHLAIFAGYTEIDGTEMKNKFSFKNNGEAFDAAVDALKACLAKEGYTQTEKGFEKR